MGRYWPIQRISVFFFHILSSEAPSMRNFIVPSCRWVWAVRGVYRAPMSQNLSKVHKFFTSLKVHNFVLKFQDLRENIILRKMCFLSLFKTLHYFEFKIQSSIRSSAWGKIFLSEASVRRTNGFEKNALPHALPQVNIINTVQIH